MIFSVLDLLIVSGFCVWIGVIGLIQMFFNNIGGNGSVAATLGGAVVALVGFCAAYWLWVEYSPFGIVVLP